MNGAINKNTGIANAEIWLGQSKLLLWCIKDINCDNIQGFKILQHDVKNNRLILSYETKKINESLTIVY